MYCIPCKNVYIPIMLMFIMGFTAVSHGDEIIDSINEGLGYYQKGNFTEAVSSLNFASQLISRKKGEKLK